MKKTKQDFIDEIKNKNPNVIVLGSYINNHSKILCKCKKHNKEWNSSPRSLLKGAGCGICKSEKIKEKVTKTHDYFMLRYKDVRDIKILGIYENSRTQILCKCKKCEGESYIFPDNLLRGQGCKLCANNKMAEERSKSDKQFKLEIFNLNKNIDVLSEYTNSEEKVLCLCKKHNHKWEVNPGQLLRNCQCPICGKENFSKTIRTTHNDFINKLKGVNPNLEVLGEYKANKDVIKCKCKIDGTVFYPIPSNTLRGQGCPTCGQKSSADLRRLTHEEFKTRVKDVLPNITILGEYKTRNEKILVVCQKDGYSWEVKGGHLIDGHGCPKCKSSKGEKLTENYLKEKCIDYEIQYKFKGCKHKRELPFDFYLPKENTVIEYDGVQHFKPIDFFGGVEGFERRKKSDITKNDYCSKNNIKIIRIPYTVVDIHEYLDEKLK